MITQGQLDQSVQYGLRNIVGSPLTLGMRTEAYNRVIDFLQSKANWNSVKKSVYFDYLNGETDYLLSNLSITDFKQYQDLRIVDDFNNRQTVQFEEINANDFANIIGRNQRYNAIAFEDKSGQKIMKVDTYCSNGDTTIDDTGDLTTGRTWASDTVNSDATAVVLDTTRVKVGSGSLMFNVNPAQSVQNYATIYTSVPFATTYDASNLLNNGYFRFWLGLHSLSAANLANITGVRLIWGSDTTATPSTKANYWFRDTALPVDNGTFQAAWNRMSFDWANATMVGSPDASKLGYFEIQFQINGSFVNASNIRIDQLKMFCPISMELVYFSKNFVSKNNIWQPYFTTTVVNPLEVILFPDTHYNLLVNLALQRLFPKKEKGSDDYLRVEKEIIEQLPLAVNQDGNPVTREKNEFKVHGESNGREDCDNNQW